MTLEESEGSAAAQQEIRGQRETELKAMKQTLEEEAASHESAVSAMRQKYSQQIEELNEQLDGARKVSYYAGYDVCVSMNYYI